MVPLMLIIAALALLGAFFALTGWENNRSTRVFEGPRARLDGTVARATFIIEHVDFNAFVREQVRALTIRFGHYVAHLSLQAVRTVERLLTQVVRQLRAQVASAPVLPAGPARPFVQALGDFKEELKATRPPVPEL